MKVNVETPAALAGSINQVTQAGEVHGKSSERAGASRADTQADRVELSPLAAQVAQAGQAHAAARARHVDSLAKLYQTGRYAVDSRDVSRKIVAQAVSGASRSAEGDRD
jgi:anti-sigma28 factor (negative regulator of flagellin synthesis)